MSALMLATEALVNPGHRVVCVTPLWPNLTEIPKILGADVTRVALRFGRGGWTLDVDRLLDALTPGTCAVVINSPNTPTGWTLSAGEQRTILVVVTHSADLAKLFPRQMEMADGALQTTS